MRTERRHSEPLLDLHLLRNRQRLGAVTVMAVIVGMHFALLFMLVQYFERALGYSPLFAGLAYLPLTATVCVISQAVPRLLDRLCPPAVRHIGKPGYLRLCDLDAVFEKVMTEYAITSADEEFAMW